MRTIIRVLLVSMVYGLVIGGVGFVLGFIGPLIITPEANQGPLLGIFITGPLGFLIGITIGIVVGLIKENPQLTDRYPAMRHVHKAFVWGLWVSAGFAIFILIFGSVWIPNYSSKRSPIVYTSGDLTKRDASLTQISGRSLSDDEITHLSKFSELNYLDFSSGWKVEKSKLTDVGLKNIASLNLPHLEQLMLGYCLNITNEGLRHLALIKTLKYLSLMACPAISDWGLANLALSKSLETIDLRGCTGVTDQGLMNLRNMASLKEVMLGGCKNVTPEGMQALRNALPKCNVKKDDEEWSWVSQ